MGETMASGMRWLALVAAIAMLVFSLYMYSVTGDWVAMVFALGSIGYIVLFALLAGKKES